MSDFKKKSLIATLILSIAVSTFFSGCSYSAENKFSSTTMAMGTVVSQTIYSNSETDANFVMNDITKLINELDTKHLSWRTQGSDIYKINEHTCTNSSSEIPEISDVTYNCIKKCLDVSEKSNGYFDITVGHLSSLWGIGTETARVPKNDEISSILNSIDYTRILLTTDKKTVVAGEGQKLDLGAVGKGLACDEIRTYLNTAKAKEKTRTEGAVISVGGSILLYGTNPSSEDGLWSIGIRNPFSSADDYAAVLKLGETCVSTSGDYEKILEANGKKYHHILNPKTGYPAESNITSVTVIADSGVLSDALSTACFILGYSDEALNLLNIYNAEAVFISKDKKVYVTDGLTDKLTLTKDNFKLADK